MGAARWGVVGEQRFVSWLCSAWRSCWEESANALNRCHTRRWVRWLRAERPDVVLTSTAAIPTPALASEVVGIPHIWWLQEFMTKDHGFRYLAGEPLSQRSIGWLSKVVVANSKAVLDHFSPPIRSEKMRLIYYGIAGFDASPNRIDFPKLRVLLLGRQTHSKGQELALNAASILKRDQIKAHFRLVGPDRHGISTRASSACLQAWDIRHRRDCRCNEDAGARRIRLGKRCPDVLSERSIRASHARSSQERPSGRRNTERGYCRVDPRWCERLFVRTGEPSDQPPLSDN